jgi:hypothetical protein
MLDAWWSHSRSGGWTANTIGKTYAEAILVLSQLQTDSCGWVLSYPTARQLRDQLWREMGNLWAICDQVPFPIKQIPFGGRLDKPATISQSAMRIEISGPSDAPTADAWAYGISPAHSSDEAEASQRMQGYHHHHKTCLHFGEASIVRKPRWDAAARMALHKWSAWGNPIAEDDQFAQFLNSLPTSARFQFSGQDCLDWQRKHGFISGLLTPETAEEFESKWHGTDIYYMGWLGRPAPKSSKAVVPYAWMLACVDCEPAPNPRRILAVDVAGRGTEGDRTVITRLVGGYLTQPVVTRGLEETEIVDEVVKLLDTPLQGWPWEVRIDDTGIGHGVTDILRRELARLNLSAVVSVIPITFGAGPSASRLVELPGGGKQAAFRNIETECYWDMRLLCQARAICVPNDHELLREVTTRDVEVGPDGRLRLQGKDEFKARHSGLSPDKADSAAMACWQNLVEKPVDNAWAISL